MKKWKSPSDSYRQAGFVFWQQAKSEHQALAFESIQADFMLKSFMSQRYKLLKK
ncbi:hypothetical protein [Comamonas sp. lk]|uniref:hypothetical protein n=1 Tax=Comamonas sp. lk TaxID=2201272 RepID=UPI0013CEE384|nr:hypothetical protein [Comamonas sp. lk]